jgi:alpha-tubulin suppressor-like RCC1 family protein
MCITALLAIIGLNSRGLSAQDLVIGSGWNHSFGITSGAVFSWGLDGDGQLGDAQTVDVRTPKLISGFSGIVEVVGGRYHTLARANDGRLWVTGRNSSGQLGLGNTSGVQVPTLVPMLGVQQVAAGSDHSAILLTDGTVWSCGYNGYGQLGLGDTNNRASFTQITGLSNIVHIECGENFSMAVEGSGAVWAWGYNAYGQLGDGTSSQRNAPVRLGANQRGQATLFFCLIRRIYGSSVAQVVRQAGEKALFPTHHRCGFRMRGACRPWPCC